MLPLRDPFERCGPAFYRIHTELSCVAFAPVSIASIATPARISRQSSPTVIRMPPFDIAASSDRRFAGDPPPPIRAGGKPHCTSE